jgi:acylphosphatase
VVVESTTQRCDVRYRGMVQGVGFRYTTRRIAQRFVVTGFVRNLPDGSVRVVAEGWPAEVRRFLDAILAELGEYVTEKEETPGAATGEFRSFDIRF